jgi:RNA polymerase sigma-70 factor, ECF subfamily
MAAGDRDRRAAAADATAFAAAIEPHRRELRVHCYRMLGSFVEAEDLVQETFLRAWRARHTFAGRATLRAWLYRIATNACLDALAHRSRRVLPHDVLPPASPSGPPQLAPEGEYAWLEPYPDHLVAAEEDEPEVLAVARETIELAFLAALQHLPPKQRAVLILRDVLGWSAAETAELLDVSVPAIKSALQRARATMRDRLPRRREEWRGGPTQEEREVVARYITALEADSNEPLAELLREDVRVDYAPLGLWADGRDDFIEGSSKHAISGEMRAVPWQANRQPAVALYLRRPGETRFALVALELLRIEGGRIAEIVDYGDPRLLAALGVPATL